MAAKKTGRYVPCFHCGTEKYFIAAYLARSPNGRRTCGKPECKSAAMKGDNNPFWGRRHDDDTRTRIKEGRAANPPKGTGPKKGIFKQTPEARAKMSAAVRERWLTKREKMLASLPRGDDHHMKGMFPEPRYRKNFTRLERREWTGTECVWCKSTEQLVLDHIFPVMCGGKNTKPNCQTLCQPCNMWKMIYVDRPLMLALGSNEVQDQT